MIGKIKDALYGVKLHAQKLHTFTRISTQRRLRYLSPASLIPQMGRNAAATLPSSWCCRL